MQVCLYAGVVGIVKLLNCINFMVTESFSGIFTEFICPTLLTIMLHNYE